MALLSWFIAVCDVLFGLTFLAYAVLELVPTAMLYGLVITGLGMYTLLFRPHVIVFSVVPIAVTLFGIVWTVSYVQKLQRKQQSVLLAIQQEIKKRLSGKNTPRHMLYAAGAIVGLVLIIAVMAHFKASAHSPASAATTQQRVGTYPSDNAADQRQSDTETTQRTGKMHEPVKDAQFTFQVDSLEYADSASDYYGNPVPLYSSTDRWCIMTVTVRNLSSSPENVSGKIIGQAVIIGGRPFYGNQEATVGNANNSGGATQFIDINAGASDTGVYVFEIPRNQQPTYAVLRDSETSPGVKIRLE